MTTPRSIAAAQRKGYVVKRINYKESSKVLMIMQPRWYNPGMKAQISFWVSRNYAKRIVGDYQWLVF